MEAPINHTDGQDSLSLLDGVVAHAADLLDPADWASVTLVRGGVARTIASSHSEALTADEIQYHCNTGPCLDAAIDDSVYITGDISREDRWPTYGRRVHAERGIHSVMAYRLLLLHGNEDFSAALNVYARARDAFDDEDVRQGTLLATQCALLVSAHIAQDRAENLLAALASNRDIGTAVGIIMSAQKIPQAAAFHVLRVASQDSNRRLRDIAEHVIATGELPPARARSARR